MKEKRGDTVGDCPSTSGNTVFLLVSEHLHVGL